MRKGSAHFDKHFPSSKIDGVPLEEMAMSIEIGPCATCGKPAEESKGGVLQDAYVENGVLKGTSICPECMEVEGGHDDMLDYVRGDLP